VKIAVIGAGLSGLTFAAARRTLAPATEVTLYERDASATGRTQGYAIGLRIGFGLEALGTLGVREPVIGSEAYKVTDFAILDQRGGRLLGLPSGENGPNVTYRIQRLHLKKVLQDELCVPCGRFLHQRVQ
jgi:2-polyprenyl-6-methoxyphenol hydroxylase-like FAD-dependent oxidoreductase